MSMLTGSLSIIYLIDWVVTQIGVVDFGISRLPHSQFWLMVPKLKCPKHLWAFGWSGFSIPLCHCDRGNESLFLEGHGSRAHRWF